MELFISLGYGLGFLFIAWALLVVWEGLETLYARYMDKERTKQ